MQPRLRVPSPAVGLIPTTIPSPTTKWCQIFQEIWQVARHIVPPCVDFAKVWSIPLADANCGLGLRELELLHHSQVVIFNACAMLLHQSLNWWMGLIKSAVEPQFPTTRQITSLSLQCPISVTARKGAWNKGGQNVWELNTALSVASFGIVKSRQLSTRVATHVCAWCTVLKRTIWITWSIHSEAWIRPDHVGNVPFSFFFSWGCPNALNSMCS